MVVWSTVSAPERKAFVEGFAYRHHRRLHITFQCVRSFVTYSAQRLHLALNQDPRLVGSLLSQMIEQFDSVESTSQEIVTLFAASTTTAQLLSWISGLLALQPDIQRKLRDEILNFLQRKHGTYVTRQDLDELVFLEAVINEATRLYPPAPLMLRQLNDKGDIVILFLWGMHRQSWWWPNAETFWPERWVDNDKPLPAFYPFGHGPRACIGKGFSQIESKVILIELLRRYELTTPLTRLPAAKTFIMTRPSSAIPIHLTQIARN